MENRTNLLTGNYASLVLSGNYTFENITKNSKVHSICQKFGKKKLLGAVIFAQCMALPDGKTNEERYTKIVKIMCPNCDQFTNQFISLKTRFCIVIRQDLQPAAKTTITNAECLNASVDDIQ